MPERYKPKTERECLLRDLHHAHVDHAMLQAEAQDLAELIADMNDMLRLLEAGEITEKMLRLLDDPTAYTFATQEEGMPWSP